MSLQHSPRIIRDKLTNSDKMKAKGVNPFPTTDVRLQQHEDYQLKNNVVLPDDFDKQPVLLPPSDSQQLEDKLWVMKNISFCPTIVKSYRTQSLASTIAIAASPKRPSTSPAKEAPPSRLPRTESPPFNTGIHDQVSNEVEKEDFI